jgi:CBS domain-containing protein
MLNDTTVSDIMSRHLITVSPNTTLDQVNAIFDRYEFHHLPVVDGEQLVGILSRHDLEKVSHCEGLFTQSKDVAYNNRLLKSLLAEEVMTRQVVTLMPSDSVGWAANLFTKNQFHALPVLEKGNLVGLVTTYDLIEYAYSGQLQTA